MRRRRPVIAALIFIVVTLSATLSFGRTTALFRADLFPLAGPGLEEAAPTFDELVLGYLDEGEPARGE